MTTPRPTRLVRRAPLMTRIKSYLNPWDFLLWLSEELNMHDDEWMETLNEWALPIGILLNVVYMAARSNAGGESDGSDAVFDDYYERMGSGWLAWMAALTANLLMVLAFANAFFTFNRKRHYRLFECPVDITPNTPSARRVRVDSSPVPSTPLKFISEAVSASGRAHPDPSRDVWEVAMWDPKPVCLRLFCLFSPGHVLLYRMFLPVSNLDPRPSVTVATAIVLAVVLSTQLTVLQKFSAQQAKDSTLVHKEVQNEYDKKFVHPTLNKAVRDISTQTPPKERASRDDSEVSTYAPTMYVNRGFQTNPNPNYSSHFDPDGRSSTMNLNKSRSFSNLPRASPIVNDSPSEKPLLASQGRPLQDRTPSAGSGGNFGVYTHAQSPLMRTPMNYTGLGAEQMRDGTPILRQSSPLKLSSSRDSPPAGSRLPRRRRS